MPGQFIALTYNEGIMLNEFHRRQCASMKVSLRGLGFLQLLDNELAWRRLPAQTSASKGAIHNWGTSEMLVTYDVTKASFSLYKRTWRWNKKKFDSERIWTLIAQDLISNEIIHQIQKYLKDKRVRGKLPGQFHMTNDEWKRFQQQTT